MTEDHYHALFDINQDLQRFMGAPSRRELAESLGIPKSTVQLIVDDLVDAGYLERVPNRARRLRVTRKGSNWLKRGMRRAA